MVWGSLETVYFSNWDLKFRRRFIKQSLWASIVSARKQPLILYFFLSCGETQFLKCVKSQFKMSNESITFCFIQGRRQVFSLLTGQVGLPQLWQSSGHGISRLKHKEQSGKDLRSKAISSLSWQAIQRIKKPIIGYRSLRMPCLERFKFSRTIKSGLTEWVLEVSAFSFRWPL